ncbi:hypothetical protein BBJ28_00025122 [Nothophytophthora sp. Chile5]|nr:hypothetical protein BBJ28_00025122 [Nothophytophthora sp. Chile5]
MLEQFIRIEEHISKLEEVDTIRRGDVRKVKDIMKALADFESVMTDIQDAGVHIGEVRDNFQLMLLDYPELKDYIDADADITRNATFEKAVVKILNGQPGSLTLEEQQQVSQFRLLFLKQNHFLWTASMVSQAIKSSAAELEELGLEEGDENAF